MSIEQEKILAYLDDQLTGAEKMEVEAAISADPSILTPYEDMNSFLKNKSAKEAAFKNLRNVHNSMKAGASAPKEEVPSDVNSKLKSILKLMALIAGVMLFFYLGYQFINKGIGQVQPSESPELLYAANFDPSDISFTSRGVATEPTLLGRAASALNEDNYSVAVDLFERGIELGGMNPRAYYAYSIALIGDGQTEKARLVLEDLSDNNPVYKDDALWYIAMSHLAEGTKQKDNFEARAALAGISKSSSRYKQAFSLLNDLGE